MAEVRSGSFETTGYSDAYSPDHYVFSWSLSSQSIVDNTSTITWSVVAAGGITSGYYNTVRERYVTVYGVTKSASDAQVSYNGTTPFSGTTVIKHDTNGKGSFTASCGGAFEYGGSYNSTGSGSWSLPTIARATNPTFSATSVEMGKSITITLSPATSSFKHKITYAFGSLTDQTSGVSIGSNFSSAGNTSVAFTPPTSLGSQIPTATSGDCKVTTYTYTSAGAFVGSVTTTVTLTIPSYTPTITGVTLTGNNLLSSTYVQGKSTVTVNATVGTSYGATTKSITTVIDGKTYSGLPFMTSLLSSGSKTASITFVDTRGKSVTATSSAIQVYEYSLPNITDFTLARQSDGTTVIATVKGSISSVNSKNAKAIRVTLNGVTNTVTSSSYTINATTTFTNVSTDKTFSAKVVFADSYVSVERDSTLPTVAVTMDFFNDGKGVAFGKVAESSDLLEVAWNGNFKKNLNVEGTLTICGKALEQQSPIFVNDISECKDTSKTYVLPDGYIYAYMSTEVNLDPKELYDASQVTINTRVNSSNVITTGTGYIITQYIPINITMTAPIVLRIVSSLNLRGTDPSFQRISYFDANKNILGSQYIDKSNSTVELSNRTLRLSVGYNKSAKLSYYDSIAFVRVDAYTAQSNLTSGAGYFESIVIEGSGGTSEGYVWKSTGLTFTSSNNETRVVELESKTSDHENRLNALETNSKKAIPSYWLNELGTKAYSIQQAMEKSGRNKSAFLWYTDSHWYNGNAKVSPLLLNYLYKNTPMNKVNFGGDIIGNSLLSTREQMLYLYEWREAIKDLPNHHSCVGNHDLFTSDSVDYESTNFTYAFLIAPEESSDMVVGGDFYYYIDNPCEKTRYLYIDNMTTDNTVLTQQANFIKETLGTVKENWHIVAISHRWFQYESSTTPKNGSVPVYTAEILNLFDAYNSRKKNTDVASLGYFPNFDFSSAKGKLEFCIGGHIHADYDFATTGGIPIILTTSDANQERHSEAEDCGTFGTTTESAVYGIIADYTNNKITVVGVGRGTSRVVGK